MNGLLVLWPGGDWRIIAKRLSGPEWLICFVVSSNFNLWPDWRGRSESQLTSSVVDSPVDAIEMLEVFIFSAQNLVDWIFRKDICDILSLSTSLVVRRTALQSQLKYYATSRDFNKVVHVNKATIYKRIFSAAFVREDCVDDVLLFSIAILCTVAVRCLWFQFMR